MSQDAASLSGSLVLRGILSIVFGVAAVFWPGLTLVALVYIFSTFILINGLVDLVFGVSDIGNSDKSVLSRFLPLLFGFFQIGVGVYLLRHPGVSFTTFVLLAGFILIARGVVEIIVGLFEGVGSSLYRVVLVLGGLLAIAAGCILLAQPVASGVAFVWILGVYALITGPLLIAVSLDIKNHGVPARAK